MADQEEADLALRYAAAEKEVVQNPLCNAPEEGARLNASQRPLVSSIGDFSYENSKWFRQMAQRTASFRENRRQLASSIIQLKLVTTFYIYLEPTPLSSLVLIAL
jgi:hypothetical protein